MKFFSIVDFRKLLLIFQRLNTSVKTIFFGSVLAIVSSALPWFQIDQLRAEEGLRLLRIPEISNGFGIFPIFGFLSLFFAVVAFLVFIQNFNGSQKIFHHSHGKVWLFVGGQAVFVTCIAIAVFGSEMRNDSTAHIRFGVLASLLGHAFTAFGGYVFEKEKEERQTRENLSPILSKELNHLNIRPEEPLIRSDQLSLSDSDERKQSVLR